MTRRALFTLAAMAIQGKPVPKLQIQRVCPWRFAHPVSLTRGAGAVHADSLLINGYMKADCEKRGMFNFQGNK